MHFRLNAGYCVSNNVGVTAQPFGIDSQEGVCKKSTKQAAKRPSLERPFAVMVCPVDRTYVVRKVKEDREWVTIVAVKEESSKGRSIVDDDCKKFQDIDRDEVAVRVVGKVELSLLNDFFGSSNMPPKL